MVTLDCYIKISLCAPALAAGLSPLRIEQIRQDKLAALQEEKRRAKAASDLQGCTFKPQINAHSRRILERREAGSTYAHRHLARQMLNGALQHRAVRWAPGLWPSMRNTSRHPAAGSSNCDSVVTCWPSIWVV